jgi:DNA-binding LacI/PurR family transcriptional regulator
VSCTLRDVAQLAGVSTATVSRVINGAENVSSKTRSKVLSAISRLKYSPDVHAVELGRGRGGIPRKRGIHGLSSTRTGKELYAHLGAEVQSQRRKTDILCLLEEENVRLKRLITNLSIEV